MKHSCEISSRSSDFKRRSIRIFMHYRMVSIVVLSESSVLARYNYSSYLIQLRSCWISSYFQVVRFLKAPSNTISPNTYMCRVTVWHHCWAYPPDDVIDNYWQVRCARTWKRTKCRHVRAASGCLLKTRAWWPGWRSWCRVSATVSWSVQLTDWPLMDVSASWR